MWPIIFLSLGVFISLLNFYLSFIRYPLHIFRGGTKENFQWVSGFPFVGTLFIVLALLLDGFERPLLIYVGTFALFIDTGGIVWMLGQLTYSWFAGRK